MRDGSDESFRNLLKGTKNMSIRKQVNNGKGIQRMCYCEGKKLLNENFGRRILENAKNSEGKQIKKTLCILTFAITDQNQFTLENA